MPTLNQYATGEPLDITLDDGKDDTGTLTYPDLSDPSVSWVIVYGVQANATLFASAVTPVAREGGTDVCRIQRPWLAGELDVASRIRVNVTAKHTDGTYTTWPKPDYFAYDVAEQTYDPSTFTP